MLTTRGLARSLFAYRRVESKAARRAAVAVGLVAAAVVALRLGIGAYLSSSRGREAVAEDLQSLIGMPVEVADVDLGTRTSVKFRVLDPTRPDRPEVLSVESAAADVSLADLVGRRASPSQLDLAGASLTLRVGPDGMIRTTLPSLPDAAFAPGPRMVVDRSRVTVKCDGRPDFSLTNISLRGQSDGGQIALTGTVDDPIWGKWSVAGAIDRATRAWWIEFTTDTLPDAERLRTIPLVPPELWGEHAGGITLRVNVGEDGKPQYTATKH